MRADPGLLYWRPVSLASPLPTGGLGTAAGGVSGLDGVASEQVLSPRYEDVAVEGGVVGPPSYVTRESPARGGREMVEVVGGDADEGVRSAVVVEGLRSARVEEVRWSGELLEARVFS